MKLKFNLTMRLQHIVFSIVIMLLITGFSSCKKFLDKPRNSQVSLLTSVKDCQDILDNPSMRIGSPVDGQRSSDDYYFTDADYKSLPEDPQREFYIWLPTAQRLNTSSNPNTDWRVNYLKVSNANVAIETLEQIAAKQPGLENGADYKSARGMGLFIRAFCFYNLATEYCKAYTTATAAQDLGIPTPLTADINYVGERGTLKQTYDRILQDLQEALSLLPEYTKYPSRPNTATVHALLARIYLSMDEFTLARQSADVALQFNNELIDYNTVSTTSDGPFPAWVKEVIYPSEITAVSKARVDSNIIKSYEENDLRKIIYFKENGGGGIGSYYYTGSYSGSTSVYFNGLSVDELYLIRAECYARANNTSSAMTDLNTLLRTRWVTGTYTDLTAADSEQALKIILQERRKELIMRGHRWADLKRLNKDPRFATTLIRVVENQTYTLPPNDLRYQLLLPLMVMDRSSMAQNPR